MPPKNKTSRTPAADAGDVDVERTPARTARARKEEQAAAAGGQRGMLGLAQRRCNEALGAHAARAAATKKGN